MSISSRLLAGILLVWSVSTHAAVSYSFSTGTALPKFFPSGPQFDASAMVSGTFMYDSEAPVSGSMLSRGLGNADIYRGGFLNIAGRVGDFEFFDPIGNVVVGNDMNDYPGAMPGQDWLGLNYDQGTNYGSNIIEPLTDPNRPRDLQGFSIGDYTLFNIRMLWFEGINGLPDFLSSNNLQGTLPSLSGRVALDFVLTEDPYNLSFSNTVFFDGFTVKVSEIPEPGTIALIGVGLLLVFRRHHLRNKAI